MPVCLSVCVCADLTPMPWAVIAEVCKPVRPRSVTWSMALRSSELTLLSDMQFHETCERLQFRGGEEISFRPPRNQGTFPGLVRGTCWNDDTLQNGHRCSGPHGRRQQTLPHKISNVEQSFQLHEGTHGKQYGLVRGMPPLRNLGLQGKSELAAGPSSLSKQLVKIQALAWAPGRPLSSAGDD
mmetsp:Transcript_64603/g.209699  ORF Transcript_64603/g.209699 Transcript_64603/m.209699 type:complete len:183 (-) Transcript_64603:187-735(-)